MNLKFGQPIPTLEKIIGKFSKLDNKNLMLKVWETQGLVLTPQQKAKFIGGCYSPETITRTKRQMKEEGEI